MVRIVYEGQFHVDYCTENHLARSFAELGHDVICSDVNSQTEQGLIDALHVHEPDMLLVTRPWGSRSSVTDRVLDICRRAGRPTVGFHLDLICALPERRRWVRTKSDPLFKLDHLFTPEPSEHWAEYGVNHHWMPPGVLAAECYDAEPDRDRWPYDVAFVGSAPTAKGGNYHKQWAHRGELVAHLRDWYGDRFVHVGNGGDVGTTRGHDLNVLYASVPVVVGDSCLTRPDFAYWSDRVPETWGRGGFLLHPFVDAMEDSLSGAHPLPGMTWVSGEWDKLHDSIEGWLGDAYARDGVRERVAKTVRAEHTYTVRAQQILDTVGLA